MAATHLTSRWTHMLERRRQQGTLRVLSLAPKGCIDFCSNDYLGIARQNAFITQEPRSHSGSTGSRLLSGNSEFCMKLEVELAHFYHSEAALLFSSGYTANLSVFSSLVMEKDCVLYDEYVHNSCREGLRLSRGKKILPFRHNDVKDLQRLLSLVEGKYEAIYIVVEGLYSMDGDECPLESIARLAERYKSAQIIIDEAHSVGIYGDWGAGLCQAKLGDRLSSIICRVYTFGKALGYHGAVVCGSETLIQYLINYARPFIYSTALPLDALQQIQRVHQLCKASNTLREKLLNLVQYFRKEIETCSDIPSHVLLDSSSPIQGILFSGNDEVKKAAEFMATREIYVYPIRYPTVPKGMERIRIVLHAYNTTEEIDRLVQTLQILCKNTSKVYSKL